MPTKRTTTKPRRRAQPSVLEVRVMSPRIAWHRFTRLLGSLLRLALLLALLVGIGYGIWRGVEHTFHNNPDFRLQIIDLNPNPVIDELGLVELTGIDLSHDTSLFAIDVEETKRRLEALPAVVEARVERHLPKADQPATLMVRITHRQPRAWVALSGTDLSAVRRVGGMLLDPANHLYPCPEGQFAEAESLAVILLAGHEDHPLTPGTTLDHPELERCLRLLEAARQADAASPRWIQSIRQANDWSLRLVTRNGTSATFALRDHGQQIERFRAALDHAAKKGYLIDTINLIPRINVPITVRGETEPPRAILIPEASLQRSPDELTRTH